MKKTVLHNYLFFCLVVFCLLFISCGQTNTPSLKEKGNATAPITEKPVGDGQLDVSETDSPMDNNKEVISMKQVPAYSGKPYVEVDGNKHIEINKIDKLAKQPNCTFVIYVGKKKLIKRKEFENLYQKT